MRKLIIPLLILFVIFSSGQIKNDKVSAITPTCIPPLCAAVPTGCISMGAGGCSCGSLWCIKQTPYPTPTTDVSIVVSPTCLPSVCAAAPYGCMYRDASSCSCGSLWCIEYPTVKITAPMDFQVITNNSVTIQYEESGNLLQVDHVHLMLDNQPEVRDLDNDGVYVFNNLTLGTHTVLVYLAKSDHSRFTNPESDDTVTFTYNPTALTAFPVLSITPTPDSCPEKPPGCYLEIVQCITTPCCPIIICPSLTPTCPLKSKGDTNCDSTIDLVDFEFWRREFTATLTTHRADYNSDGQVDLIDFEFWRRNFAG